MNEEILTVFEFCTGREFVNEERAKVIIIIDFKVLEFDSRV